MVSRGGRCGLKRVGAVVSRSRTELAVGVWEVEAFYMFWSKVTAQL